MSFPGSVSCPAPSIIVHTQKTLQVPDKQKIKYQYLKRLEVDKGQDEKAEMKTVSGL